jgi:hypothetical protein
MVRGVVLMGEIVSVCACVYVCVCVYVRICVCVCVNESLYMYKVYFKELMPEDGHVPSVTFQGAHTACLTRRELHQRR